MDNDSMIHEFFFRKETSCQKKKKNYDPEHHPLDGPGRRPNEKRK